MALVTEYLLVATQQLESLSGTLKYEVVSVIVIPKGCMLQRRASTSSPFSKLKTC